MEEPTLEEEGIIEGADADEASYDNETDTLDEEVSNKNSESDFLTKAKEITGRDFKDEEDFKKHYKNLSSFVGKKVTQKVEPKGSSDRVAELEFKVDHPEYKEHFDIIKMVSKEKGLSYNDAISDPMVKELVEVRQSKKGESVIHSNNKISSSNPNLTKLKQNVSSEEGLKAYLMALNEEQNGQWARLTKFMDSLFKTYEAIGNREDLTDIIAE